MHQYVKISTFKLKKIIKHFCVDIQASKTSILLDINRNTINHWYMVFRRAIYAYQMREFEKIFGEAEIDESYFGARRKRGFRGKLKRGRGTLKQPVFGIFKRDGRVYTEIVPKTAGKRRYRPLFGEKLTLPQSSTLTSGAAMTGWWTWVMTNTSGSTTRRTSFQPVPVSTLTASRISGASPSAGCPSSTALKNILNSTSRTVNGDTDGGMIP